MKRLKILLSNDDGIDAKGLQHLWQALHKANIADLAVIAPSSEKSGSGVGITWDKPISVRKVDWGKNTLAWAVDGTPADCVKMGVRVLLDFTPDFIVSGINAGSNAGRNVLHSGTVGAVIEGVFRNIPGVAFSCENGQTPNFEVAEKYIETVLRYLLEHPLPQGSFLNVNFPQSAKEKVKGFCLTRQGKGRWSEDPSLHLETQHGPSYLMGGKPEELDEDNDSDISLLRSGYMTAVPIYVHELTDLRELEQRRKKFEEFFLKNSNT